MKRYDTMGFESEHGVWVRAADAEARICDLKAAFENYGQHLRGCRREDTLPCSCGFIKATQGSTAQRQEKP